MLPRTLPSCSLFVSTLGPLALIAALFAPAHAARAQQPLWAGYAVDRAGWAATPDLFLGRVQVGRYVDQLWIYSEGIGSHFHLPQDFVQQRGAWAYAPYLEDETYDFQWATLGWLHARASGAWVYAPMDTLSAGQGWTYVLNGATAVPLPENIVLTEAFTASPPAYDVDPPGYTNTLPVDAAQLARFANAMRLGPGQIAEHLEHDPEITMTSGPEGLTFTNTAAFGNRFVKFFHHPVAGGLIDFSRLDDYTGKVGVTVRAGVDLSAVTGGFYCRMKHFGIRQYVEENPDTPDHIRDLLLELTDAGAYSRLASGIVDDDVLLENYANEWTDPVYVELTLPPFASATVKEVFLHMDTEIRGFADIAARITGGEGASPENTHTVSNVDEMLAALDAVRAAAGPSIIYVDGTLSLEDWEAAGGDANRQFSVSEGIRDLSVIGVGANALLDGLGFKVHGVNIIFRNLTIRYLWMRNAFEINNARYVHVTRCTMHGDLNDPDNRFDEFMSVKNQARYVIISWNHMHSDINGRGILMGSNGAEEALPDRKVIIHHNWFQNVGSRHPLVRGGYTHIYNNFYDNVRWGANIRPRARVRMENNYIRGADRAIFPGEEPEAIAGAWELAGNLFDGGDSRYQPTESTITLNFEPAYTYTLDPAADVPAIVTAGAGALTQE